MLVKKKGRFTFSLKIEKITVLHVLEGFCESNWHISGHNEGFRTFIRPKLIFEEKVKIQVLARARLKNQFWSYEHAKTFAVTGNMSVSLTETL